jgi:2-amino-4-hydroxy-6-hydroxymethyldihydropteridine diphosphokinase
LTTRVALGLGSNLGDRWSHLDAGYRGIGNLGTVAGRSSFYEAAPIGGDTDQDWYLNAVALLDTSLDPRRLLDGLLAIELTRGRIRTERWGPRTLDLDILLFGTEVIDEPGLTVPHPEMLHRRFVLEPLVEVWPDATLPDGRPISGFLEQVRDQGVVKMSKHG